VTGGAAQKKSMGDGDCGVRAAILVRSGGAVEAEL